MNIRRERTHQTGISNIDFKKKGEPSKVEHYNPSLKYTDFGTMNKSRYQRMPSAATFKEQVAISGGWQNSKYKNDAFKNAKYETATEFYQNKGK